MWKKVDYSSCWIEYCWIKQPTESETKFCTSPLESRASVFPGGDVIPQSSDVSTIFLRLSASRTYSFRASFPTHSLQESKREGRCNVPREITYDSWYARSFLLPLASYKRAFSHATMECWKMMRRVARKILDVWFVIHRKAHFSLMEEKKRDIILRKIRNRYREWLKLMINVKT